MIKSERDKYLLIGLIGVLFVVIAWFLVASPVRSKTEEIRTANVSLKETADYYVEISAGLEEYEKRITKLTEEKESILNSFPANVSREDQIMFLTNMESSYKDDLTIYSLTMGEFAELVPDLAVPEQTPATDEATDDTTADTTATDETTVAEAALTAEETAMQEIETNANAYHLFYAPTTFNFLSTYRGLKDMITHLYAQTEKMNITDMTVAFDSTTGNLTGTINMNQFYMLGTDKSYTPAKVPTVPKGVNDIFHTVEGAGLIAQESEESTETTETDE